MTEHPHDGFTENEDLAEAAPAGVTRRELFQIGPRSSSLDLRGTCTTMQFATSA
jgi:hypothetical protein